MRGPLGGGLKGTVFVMGELRNKQQGWVERILGLPNWVKGAIGLFTLVSGFVIAFRANVHLSVTISVALVLAALFCLSAYVVLSRTPPLLNGGKGVYRFEKLRPFALVGAVLVLILIAVLLANQSTRSFVIAALVGTPTPTPMPTPTATPTPSSSIEIATLSVKTERQADGTLQYTAQLSIEPLEYGELRLEVPLKMRVGESGVIRLTIAPDSALSNLPQIPIGLLPSDIDFELTGGEDSANTPSYVLQVNDRIQVYPIMSVELAGANFSIAPSSRQVVAVTSSTPLECMWSITPINWGWQSIVLIVSVPVVVSQSGEWISSHPLKTIPMEIFVEGGGMGGGLIGDGDGGCCICCVPILISNLMLILFLIWLTHKITKSPKRAEDDSGRSI